MGVLGKKRAASKPVSQACQPRVCLPDTTGVQTLLTHDRDSFGCRIPETARGYGLDQTGGPGLRRLKSTEGFSRGLGV
jgi:hypothetical protein